MKSRLWGVALMSVALSGCKKPPIFNVLSHLALEIPAAPELLTTVDGGAVIDFGPVLVGLTATEVVDLTTIDPVPIAVATAQLANPDSGFVWMVSGGQVTSAAALPTTLSFSPQQPGLFRAVVDVPGGAGAPLTVWLRGEGVALNLTATPNPLDFGGVLVNHGESRTVMLTNGTQVDVPLIWQPVQATDPTMAAWFSFTTPAPALVKAGAALPVNLAFAPTLPQAARLTASLTASICQGCDAGITIQLTALALDRSLALNTPLHFGAVSLGSSLTKNATVVNLSNQPVSLQSVTQLDVMGVTPAEFVAAQWVDLDGGGPFTVPGVLAPGAAVGLPLTFTPPNSDRFFASFKLQSSDPGGGNDTFSLDGYGGGAILACSPSNLEFDQVGVTNGSYRRLQVVCVNQGTEVPHHPEANLYLNALLVDGGSVGFRAQLDQPNPAQGFLPGQSGIVDVFFEPSGAGAVVGALSILSNDVNHSPLVIPLAGTGIELGPCQFEVTPAPLDLGLVTPGATATRPFYVVNTGASRCALSDLALLDGGDPAFELLTGGVTSFQLSFVGDPNNPLGDPSALPIPIGFSPSPDTTAVARGGAAFQIANHSQPVSSEGLLGESGHGCLSIFPPELAFGAVGYSAARQQWCSSQARSIQITNTCASQVLVSLQLQSDDPEVAQFELSGAPLSAVNLAPGDLLSFQVSFRPTGRGDKYASLVVQGSDNPSPRRIGLGGTGALKGQQTQQIVVAPVPVDILMVVNDVNNLDQVVRIQSQSALPALISAYAAAGVDYHIAVMSSATLSSPLNSGCPIQSIGRFEPCLTCFNRAQAEAIVVTPTTRPDPGSVLYQLMLGVANGNNDYGPNAIASCVSMGDVILAAPYLAFQPGLGNSHNAGFLRRGAKLALLAIDGDRQEDLSPLPVDQYISFFQSLKSQPSQFSYSYVGYGFSAAFGVPPHVGEAVYLSNGRVFDSAVTNWQDLLAAFNAQVLGIDSFDLDSQPDPASLQVSIDGVPVPATDHNQVSHWTYNAIANSVDFNLNEAPTPGSTLVISFNLGCQ